MEKVKITNTKREIFSAYESALQKIGDLEQKLLNPEKKIQEKKVEVIRERGVEISKENIPKTFSDLTEQTTKLLGTISAQITDQVKKYDQMNEVIQEKEIELKEIYGIEKTAMTLAALIEAQNQKKQEFEEEMNEKKENLENEIKDSKLAMETEKREYQEQKKQQKLIDEKEKSRLQEEFDYNFQRRKLLAENALSDELNKREREFNETVNIKEKELTEREKLAQESEAELEELRKRVAGFDDELQKRITKAVKDTTERVQLELKHEHEMKENKLEGEKKVMQTRIDSLEIKVKELSDMLEAASTKLERSYQQVQDVAIKAIEGASKSNSSQYRGLFSEKNSKNQED